MTERDQMRRVFFEAWQKNRENKLLEPLEALIVDIILLHPEYHAMFDHPHLPIPVELQEAHPFLHISLHLALREQISADRPAGIKIIFEQLCLKFQDKQIAEHRMLDCLGQILWDAQQTGRLPDEQYYLEKLRRI